MRVMWKDCKGDLAVVELVYASYGEFEYMDNGQEKVGTGLIMSDGPTALAGATFGIPGLDKSECDSIVKTLAVSGTFDLSSYHSFSCPDVTVYQATY